MFPQRSPAAEKPEKQPAPKPEAKRPVEPMLDIGEAGRFIRWLHRRWALEEAEMRKGDPGFSLREALKNPAMRRMMRMPGMRMQEAYRAAYYDRLMENTARAVERGVVDRVRERGVRPAENGIHSRGAMTAAPDVSRMSRAQREALERSLAKDEERIEMLDKMVLRLYEDRMEGRISEENFDLMLHKTQAEQAQLRERAARDRKKLADEEKLVHDARQWAEAIREYADITELDAATLHRLVKEIVVHESIDAGRIRHITIEIHFNLKPIAAAKPVTA